MTTARARDAPPRSGGGWSDPAFARVAEVVHVVSGLVFPPNRQPSAEAAMRRAMAAMRLDDADALARAVRSPGEARSVLLAELTVGESYFFREEGQLDVLRSEIVPSLLATRAPNEPLRVWSAGCASGEEPYSVAILLRELGWTRPAVILGTDVAHPRLDAARRGRYTRWSLRGVSPARVERWFEQRGTHFQLDPGIRGAVQFALLNLAAADDYPTAATGTLGQDLVLCRNVLIYFDMETVVRTVTRLLAALAPDGWLLLGASDPPLSGLVPCEVVLTPGGVAYRRGAATSTPRHAPPRAPPPDRQQVRALATPPPPLAAPRLAPRREATREGDAAAEAREAAAAYAAADYPRAEWHARRALEGDSGLLATRLVLLRALANQGRLDEAEDECIRALGLHRMSPELHYLHATLLGSAKRYAAAVAAARRALYLDRRFVMAHLQLGDMFARLGDRERAGRAFANALRELESLPEGTEVAAADGVTASRLRRIAELRLRGVGEAPSA